MIYRTSTNLELKARDPDPRSTLAAAKAVAATDYGTLIRRDTFFWLPAGRLKLRRHDDRLLPGAYADYIHLEEQAPEHVLEQASPETSRSL